MRPSRTVLQADKNSQAEGASEELATSQKNGRDFVNEEEESVTAEELGTEVTLRQAMALPGAYTHPL